MKGRSGPSRAPGALSRGTRPAVALGLVLALTASGLRPAFAAEPGAANPRNSAQLAPRAADDQQRAQAKAKYEQGVEAYRAEHYADAVRSFLEADAISPSAALSYNIARAYEKLSDDAQALRWYRNYLRINPNAANAADVTRYVERLSLALSKKGIQQLTVLSTPAGATVAIDGNPLGVTPLTVELSPGPHTALLSKRGFADASSPVELPASHPIDVAVELRVAPVTANVAASGPPGRRFGVAPWVTLGVATACLGGALGFELARRSAQNSAQKEDVQLNFENDVSAMNSRRTTSRVLLLTGSALAITGVALLAFNKRLTPESRAVVAGVPGGATLTLERSF